MSQKVKLFLLITCTAAAILFGLFAYLGTKGPAALASRLPLPSESSPYLVFETDQEHFPISLSALLTEGKFALLREGSSGNRILSISKASKECAVLAEYTEEGFIDIYSVLRLDPEEQTSLSKGSLPASWEKELGASEMIGTGENGSWEVRTRGSSIYCRADKNIALLAQDMESFSRMLNAMSGSAKKIPAQIWKHDSSWPAHIMISDGGLLLTENELNDPVTVTAAWKAKKNSTEAKKEGEAVWRIDGLDKRLSPIFLKTLEPKTWDTANSVIPEPMLVSAGMNIPELKGSPKEWPFPLNSVGELGSSMGLSEKKIKEILHGETIFSVGGYNKLLWFSLPGIMVEFTGEKEIMRELVDRFWEKLFFGAEPEKLEGFDFGGTTNVPFSVIGAGRNNSAILGLLSPESLDGKVRLGSFMKKGQKAIGWVVADMPKLGSALSDMTRMNAFMNEPDIIDEGYYQEDTENIFQPDTSFSPFDQSISDSFANVLKGMGRAVIIWETPDSGKIQWSAGRE